MTDNQPPAMTTAHPTCPCCGQGPRAPTMTDTPRPTGGEKPDGLDWWDRDIKDVLREHAKGLAASGRGSGDFLDVAAGRIEELEAEITRLREQLDECPECGFRCQAQSDDEGCPRCDREDLRARLRELQRGGAFELSKVRHLASGGYDGLLLAEVLALWDSGTLAVHPTRTGADCRELMRRIRERPTAPEEASPVGERRVRKLDRRKSAAPAMWGEEYPAWDRRSSHGRRSVSPTGPETPEDG